MMRSWSFISIIGSLLLLTSACTNQVKVDSPKENKAEEVTSASTDKTAEVKFSCTIGENNGKSMHTTVIENSLRDDLLTIIYWDPENLSFGDEWTPKKRCQEVSERFQKFFDRDKIAFITADKADWTSSGTINVICSVQKKNADCKEEDLLFTLQLEDDPNKVLEDLVAFRQEPSSSKSLTRGGSSEETPTSFNEGKRIYFNLGEEIDTFNNEPSSKDKSNFAF